MLSSKSVPVAPSWLLACAESGRKKSANDNLMPLGILSEGSRNVSLTSFGGSLIRTQNLTEDQLYQALLSYNNIADRPLCAGEVLSIAKSLFRYAEEILPAVQDIPISRHIASSINSNCRYVPEWGWMVFDGFRWVPDMGGIQTRECIKRQLEATYEGVRARKNPEVTNKAHGLLAGSKVTAVISMVQSDHCLKAEVSEFDAISELINFQNGTLNLKTMVLSNHDPEDMLTKVGKGSYAPGVGCPQFDEFLGSVLPLEHQFFVLRLLGYSMLGKPLEQVLAIFTGIGANGKSTLLNTVAYVLGDYATNVEPSSLLQQKGERVRNDVARLNGARFVGTSELAIGQVLDAPLIKRFTGGDRITARALYKEYFEFEAAFVVFMATNALPVINGGDEALARRLLIVPFTTTVPAERRDPELPRKLKEEAPGILNRLLEGLKDYLENGLAVPEDIKKEAAKFCASSDMLEIFLEEKCEIGSSNTVGSADLIRHYRTWNEANGLRPFSTPQFNSEISKKLGLSSKKTKTGKVWQGFRLRPPVF